MVYFFYTKNVCTLGAFGESGHFGFGGTLKSNGKVRGYRSTGGVVAATQSSEKKDAGSAGEGGGEKRGRRGPEGHKSPTQGRLDPPPSMVGSLASDHA